MVFLIVIQAFIKCASKLRAKPVVSRKKKSAEKISLRLFEFYECQA